MTPLRVLVVGAGDMGASHARAYAGHPGFEVCGLVAPSPIRRDPLAAELGGVPTYDSYDTALAATQPDVVSINSYPDTHVPYARTALEQGCHVFCEKPLAPTVAEAEELAELAQRTGRTLLVGYILRVHPAWQLFIEQARELGKPLVMRLNLNQQSQGELWRKHRNLMASVSPLVDCGVHYVDVMCQMTGARPVRVSAMGARLSDEVPDGMYTYGQLQVWFDDGSVGWYEAGWGPMMSRTAEFVKDVAGPRGSVSIVPYDDAQVSADGIAAHTRTQRIRRHHAELDGDTFARVDDLVSTEDEPDHQGLCDREAALLYEAITGQRDLGDHVRDAVESLRVVLAADESIRSGRMVEL